MEPNCLDNCNLAYYTRYLDETARHKAAMEACPDEPCKTAEVIQHKANMDAIYAAWEACRDACNGGGTGGGA